MTPELGAFVTPLLLLPGVALLVMSTSARYGQLHSELHQIGTHHHADALERARRLLERGTLFRSALVCLYLAVALLALASAVGGVMALLGHGGQIALMALTCGAIFCLLLAAGQLFRESRLSLDVLREHVEDLEADAKNP